MQQFKPYYLGRRHAAGRAHHHLPALLSHLRHRERRATRRATSPSSRCSATSRSATTSRREAIAWALEFSDAARHRPRRASWVSVFGGDDAGAGRRRGDRDLEVATASPTSDIVRLGRGDNFWGPAGATGPLRALLRALLRHGRGDRLRTARLRPGLRLRPLHGVLEPRLRAVRDGRARRPHAAGQARASTPAWASSASPRSTRASPTSSRPTPSGR